MRKIGLAVILVTLAAIGPSFAQTEVSGPRPIGEVRGQMPAANHLRQRRVFVRFEFSGDSYRLREWFPHYFQLKVAQSGLAEVEVWDQDWNTVTEAQDRIQQSGRYSVETANQVPVGQMHAPTDYYMVTVKLDRHRTNLGANLRLNFSGTDIRVSDYVSTRVELNVQPWDIRTGALGAGWTASGSAKGLDGIRVSGGSWTNAVNVNAFISGVEQSLEGRAAKAAVEDFLRKFQPAPLDIPAVPVPSVSTAPVSQDADPVLTTYVLHPIDGNRLPITITVTSGKTLKPGDSVVFWRLGERSAKYYVLPPLRGQDAEVKTLIERYRPQPGDPFDIVRP